MKRLFLLITSFAAIFNYASAQFDPFAEDEGPKKTEASLISEVSSTAAGETFTVAIKLKHEAGWHAYYKNPGGPGLPLEFDWKLPEGYQLKKLHWPTPHLYTNSGTQFYVYENEYYFLADISTPATAKTGDTAQISVTPQWQLCNEKGCDPPASETITIGVPVEEAVVLAPDKADSFKQARAVIPSKSSPWEVTVEVTSADIVLTLKTKDGSFTKLKSAHYIDDSGATDPEKKQTLTELDDGYTLQVPRAEDIAIEGDLTGILMTGDHRAAVLNLTTGIDTPKTDATAVPTAAKSSGHGTVNEAPSEEDIATAAKLYDSDTKIDFVLLDGTKEKTHNLLTALGFIFIGGFLLNLMPCVFPVLGIKVMGFAQQAGSEPRKIKIHGLVFMAGLVVSMWVLAGIIYTLIFAFGRDINWGEQLTSPIFLAAMIMLLYLFGLNMAGLFEVGTSLTGAGGDLQSKKGYSGSFFSGVLTTLIATPCSGPFLGGVMGYTLKQPALQGMLIFTVFALGISVPYVVLAFFPKLINKLPRPGAWMVTFKQLMAFALFATAAYFFRSFAKITGTGGASWLLMAVVIVGLAAWAYGRFGTPFTPKTKKFVWGFGFPLLVATGAFFMTKSATEERAPATPLTGSSWYPGVVELNQSKKRIVWVDHTADW